MAEHKIGFLNRGFFKKTAFGRTISGRNKAGQALGLVKDVALSFTPLRKLSEATGHVTDSAEAREMNFSISELNLSKKQFMAVKWFALGLLGVLILGFAFGFVTSDRLILLFELVMSSGALAMAIPFVLFAATQGERYRVIAPPDKPNRFRDTKSRRFGQGAPPDRYVFRHTGSDGKEIMCEDLYGDVITASANVAYPRGASIDYRSLQYIDEHPGRFHKLED